MEFRQLAKVMRVYWRKYSGISPIDESHEGILAKVQWNFAIGESSYWRKSNWRNSGIPKELSFLYYFVLVTTLKQ